MTKMRTTCATPFFIAAKIEKEWKVLKDKLAEKYYTWDAIPCPTAPTICALGERRTLNPTADALTTSRDSERFVIDNTPPTIEHLESSIVAVPRKEDRTQTLRNAPPC